MEESKNYNLITTIMFISGIIVMASLYTALPLTATFAEDFHVPESIATLNGVLFSLTYSISCLFYGTISEKYGRIKTILVGMSALVIICLMIGIVHSFTVLLILRALQGVFAASFSPVVMTYTTETYPRVKRVTAISFISTSFMLSGVLGQNMSELVVSYLNWQWVYFILTILYLILVLVIYKNVPESPHKNPDIQLIKFKDNLKVFYCLFISLTLLIMFISMYDILNEYVTSHQVGGDMSVSSMMKLFGVIGMLLSLLAGRVSSRIGIKRLLTIALTTCIVSIILMGVTTNIILITTFSVLFVAGIAFAIPTVISKIGVVVKNNQGFFLSVNTFVLFLGTAIAPILMLFVGELSNFFLQFLMIAIVGLIALVVSIFMPGDQRS